MGGDPTTFQVVTAVMFLLTGGMAVFRFMARADSNWPLVYYFLLVAYAHGYERSIDDRVVYGGVALGLFLRFEIMGGRVAKFFRLLEFMLLVYVCWRCLGLILMW